MIGSAFRCCAGKRIRTAAIATGRRHLENFDICTKRTRACNYFSSSAKKEPKFSNRNKRDLLILAVGTCGAFGYHILHRNSNWDQDVWTLQNKLIGKKRRRDETANGRIVNSTKMLPQNDDFPNRPPPAVLQFIEKVLSEPMSSGEDYSNDIYHQRLSWPIATATQSGEFYASKQWYPFDATLMAAASTENPGFVWDARTTILQLSNRIVEYFITHHNENNETGIVTKIWGKYPLIQVEEEDPYLLFWLAMTPLFPTVFLQLGDEHGRSSVLKWNDNDIVFRTEATKNNRKGTKGYASAELDDGSDKYFAEFFFGENDQLYKIKVTSPSLPQSWQAIYSNYQEHVVIVKQRGDSDDGNDSKVSVLIPSNIEIGKGEGDDYQAHFKINNWHLSYEI